MAEEKKIVILIADKDEAVCDTLSGVLTKSGFTTIAASGEKQLLELLKEKKPKVALIDLFLSPASETELLKKLKEIDPVIPIFVTTDTSGIASVALALEDGAYDYLQKPFDINILLHKIEKAMQMTYLVRENTALSEMVSLHQIANTLVNTHNVDDLLDVVFKFFVDGLKVDSCAILLVEKEEKALVLVRRSADVRGPEKSLLGDMSSWHSAKQSVATGKMILMHYGAETEQSGTVITASAGIGVKGSLFVLPLKTASEVVGVIRLARAYPFTDNETGIMEVLATQAGTAISNATLYFSLKQKISEMSIIARYSDNFVGMVDLPQVILCLIDTVKSYFTVDVIGYLDIKKRFHQFHYWTRGRASEGLLELIIGETVAKYNSVSKIAVPVKRIKPLLLNSIPAVADIQTQTLAFIHIIPLVWGDYNFGALFFGAEKNPDQKEEKISLLTNLVSQTKIALTSAKLYSQMKENYIRTIKALAIAVDAKDPTTYGHSENVMQIAEAIATEMNVGTLEIGTVRDSGLLHDIGKIGIPGYILNKPGPLTSEEFNGIMKTHSTLGANIVREVPFLQELASLILYHHEHPDGSGYPEGLLGDAIPLGARIIHVADAFEAMVANRPYRTSLGKKEAIQRLTNGKGKDFDSAVVEAFFTVAKKKGWLKDNDFA